MFRSVVLAGATALTIVTLSSLAQAQLFTLTREQLVAYTAQNPFERLPDGRPKVPDALIARARALSSEDILTVLPGTLPAAALTERLRDSDAAVVMKLGSNFAKVRDAIRAAGLMERAIYVERGTMAAEIVMPLKDHSGDIAPYFAMVLVPGNGRRP